MADYDVAVEAGEEVAPETPLALQKIGNILGKKSKCKKVEDSYIGIEFENETEVDVQFPPYFGAKLWMYHPEHSLRYNGFEFVSKPLPFSEKEKAVKLLFDNLVAGFDVDKPKNLPLTNSIRTSIHAHFDVNLMNYLNLVNFSCLYWMLEPFLQDFCGRHRQGNLFCLRMKDAQWLKFLFKKELESSAFLKSQLFNENFRYASLNLNSVSKFGTLEFRLMRGVSREEPIFIWLDALEAIRKFSLKFETPAKLRDFFLKEIDARELPDVVFGKSLANTIRLNSPNGPSFSLTEETRNAFLSVLPILNGKKDYSAKALLKEEGTWKKKFFFSTPDAHISNPSSSFTVYNEATTFSTAPSSPQISFTNSLTTDQLNSTFSSDADLSFDGNAYSVHPASEFVEE